MSNAAEFCEGCVHVRVCKYTETIREGEAFLSNLYISSGGILNGNGIKCDEKFKISIGLNEMQPLSMGDTIDCSVAAKKRICGSCPDAGSEYVVENSRFVQCKRTDMWHGENEECSLENKA